MKLAILILAAGKSSRMKAVKQLLKIKGKTLLETAYLNAKNTEIKDIYCVLGANAAKIESEINLQEINFIFNKNYKTGLSSSIVAGVNYLEEKQLDLDGILIMLADQPEVDTVFLHDLIDHFKKNKSKIIATDYQTNIGVPAIFPEKYFNELKLLKGDKGAKDFMARNSQNSVSIHRKNILIDIDTPEEYESYIKSI